MNSSLENKAASPAREDHESVLRDNQMLMQTAMLEQLTTALPCVLLIVNTERQIVYKNQQASNLPDGDALGEILGKRSTSPVSEVKIPLFSACTRRDTCHSRLSFRCRSVPPKEVEETFGHTV